MAYPKLDEAQLSKLRRCTEASLRRVPTGQTLFSVGDRDFAFYVIVSGEVEIIDRAGDQPKTITVHGPGQFTGDVAHLTGSPSVVRRGRARTDCDVYEVSAEALRRAPESVPRALRHHPAGLHRAAPAPARVGRLHRRARDRLALLARHVPHPRLPLQEPRALHVARPRDAIRTWSRLLQHFGVSEAETPVVACGRACCCAIRTNRELAEALGIRQPLDARRCTTSPSSAPGPPGSRPRSTAPRRGCRTVRARAHGARRPGRQQHAHRELPRLPDGHHRQRARGARRAPGQQVRRAPVRPHARRRVCTSTTRYPVLELDGGETVVAKCLLIATGAKYRRLDVEGCERFEGCGVYYAATFERGASSAAVQTWWSSAAATPRDRPRCSSRPRRARSTW